MRRAHHHDRAGAGRWLVRILAAGFILVHVALPVAAVMSAALEGGPRAALDALLHHTALHALWLTIWTASAVTLINAVLGTMTAWVLARYRFPGRGVFANVVDLPFALPTVVAGLMILVLYGPQNPIGAYLASFGLRILFAPPGILIVLAFVTFPLVVRAVHAALSQIEAEQEEVALTLGASPAFIFWHIFLPALLPAIVTGALLTFARAIGEFGALVVVAGNIPRRTLTAPVYIYGALESGEMRAAGAMSVVLLLLSAGLIWLSDLFLRRRRSSVGVMR